MPGTANNVASMPPGSANVLVERDGPPHHHIPRERVEHRIVGDVTERLGRCDQGEGLTLAQAQQSGGLIDFGRR